MRKNQLNPLTAQKFGGKNMNYKKITKKLTAVCVFLALSASSAFAGAMAAGLVLIGPKGEVIRFYKSSDLVIV